MTNDRTNVPATAGNQVQAGIVVSTAATGYSADHIALIKSGNLDFAITSYASEHEVTPDLPEHFQLQIGRIMSFWAFAEWVLAGTLCTLLHIDRSVGRELFTGVRTNELWNKINRLLNIFEVPQQRDWGVFAGNLRKGEEVRNLLGHGIWIIDTDTKRLCVQNPKGEWKIGNKSIGSKVRYPEAFPITNEWFASTINNMIQWIGDIRNFDLEIQAWLNTSRGKEVLQSIQDQSAQDRTS